MIPFTSCVCQKGRHWKLSEALERRGGICFERTDQNALYVRMLGDVILKSHPERTREKRHSCIAEAEYTLLDGLTKKDYRPRCSLRFPSLHRAPKRHRARSRCSSENASILDDLYSGQAKCLLKTVGHWDFNIYNLDKLTSGRPLFYLTMHLFREHGFIERFQLDTVKIMRCVSLIEDSYHSNNPYHHAVHAADVTQAMHCYLMESQLAHCVTPMETMIALLSAATHDIDHPGVNQAFLIATKNHLAELYQNTSVLENHHWRTAVGIIHESQIFEHFTQEDWDYVECTLRSLILATDITRQQEFLTQFRKHIDNQDFDLKRRRDHRHFILQIALKCADICNVCRPWEISKQWSKSVCEEFFQQGKFEKSLGLPVTPNCDVKSTTVAKIQAGFIQYVVGPLFKEWYRFLPTKLGDTMVKNLNLNHKRWQTILEEIEAEKEREKENAGHRVQENITQVIKLEPLVKLEDTITFDTLTDMIMETRYELAPPDPTMDIPIRLQLRRHSLPPSVPKPEMPSYLVRRQSFPHIGNKQPGLPKLGPQSTSYQYIHERSLDKLIGGDRSLSVEAITSHRPRITTLSPSVETSHLTSLSPTPEESQKYLSSRRASFPLIQKTVSKTTFTSTKLQHRREPLAQLPVGVDSNRQPTFHGRSSNRNYPEGSMKRKDFSAMLPERLRHKRLSDPCTYVPHMPPIRTHSPELSSQEDITLEEEQRFFRPIQLENKGSD